MSVRRAHTVGAAALLAGALVFGAVQARALTKDQCVDANTKAQSLRRDGKFGAAREQLTACIDARCPGIVRDDCTERLDELERAQPTIVFDAKSTVGDDLVLVKVTVDGVRLVDILDGRALAVDPGPHAFTFEAAGQAPTSLRFVLKEGEKDRRERVVLAGSAEPPAPTLVAPPIVAAGPSGGQSQRSVGLVLGAAGAAGIAVGAVFGVLTFLDWAQSQRECSSTRCSQQQHDQAVSDHDRAQTAGTISTVGFITGGVLLATGVVVWLTSPSTRRESAAVSAHLSPAVAPGVAGFSVTGRF